MKRLGFACALASVSTCTALSPVPAEAFAWLRGLTSSEAATRELWSQADGQFVRLISQDRLDTDAVPANDHPISLSPAVVAQALSRLELFGTSDLGVFAETSARTTPVFVTSEIETLAVQLAQGLNEARPDQDLIFAVVGMHQGPIAKERQIVSGRVFVRHGQLNLIFGDLHRSFAQGPDKDMRGLNVEVDRRLYPFVPGTRAAAVDHKWRLVTGAGVSFVPSPEGSRDDWVQIDLASADAHDGRTSTSVPDAASQPRKRKVERELPQMRQQLTVKERLKALEELRHEGLIDEQEWRTKRRQILEDL